MTLHHRPLPGTGVGRATLELRAAFARAGHDVDLFTFDDLPSRLRDKGRWLAFPWAVASLLARTANQYDVVDASTGDLWVHGSRPGRRADGPLLVTRSHGLETANHQSLRDADALEPGSLVGRAYHGGYRLWEVRRSLRVADAAFLLNEAEREEAVHEHGCRRNRTAVVEHGLSSYMLGLPSPGGDDQPLRVAFLGSHSRLKGSDVALAALGSLLAEDAGRRATLLGLGTDRDGVVGSLPAAVRDRVTVHPTFAHEQLPRLLADHHVLLAPALGEGYGLGVMEAMACGLAPIVGSAPGPRRFVIHGVNGVVTDNLTANALISHVRRLDRDRDVLAALRRAAHESVQPRTWDAAAADQLGWFERWSTQPGPSIGA